MRLTALRILKRLCLACHDVGDSRIWARWWCWACVNAVEEIERQSGCGEQAW